MCEILNLLIDPPLVFWLGLLVGFDDGLPDGFTDGLALGDGVG